jgi:hypothetical protein
MSQVRVHDFSISLDGFGTGDGITFDAPFGHAGERLHEWMIATRFWHSMVGEPGGTEGVDHAFAERHEHGIGAEIMGRGKFTAQTGPWTDVGTDAEWRGWWGPDPPFHTPVFVLTHHPRPLDRDGRRHRVPLRRRQPAGRARPRPGGSRRPRRAHRRWSDHRARLSWPPGSSTRRTSCRCRSCSAVAFGSGTASRAWRMATTSRRLVTERRHPPVDLHTSITEPAPDRRFICSRASGRRGTT